MRRLAPMFFGLSLLVQVACQDQEPQRTPIAPTIAILEPDDSMELPIFDSGDTITFAASASDNYDASADLVVQWSTTWLDDDNNEQREDLGSSTVENDGRSTLYVNTLAVGTHTVQASVTDSDDLTSTDYVDLQVRAYNQPPTVTLTSPVDGNTFDSGEAINFAATATDDGDVSELQVQWRSQLDGTFDTTSPGSNGVMQFSFDNLSGGDHQISVEVTDDAGQSAGDSIEITVIPENQPPTMPVVTITPPGPGTEDDLTCTAAGSTDPEGATVTYVYEWDLDGSPSGWTGTALGAQYTTLGQQWTCWATPSDDEGLEGNPGYATVEIGNTEPSYSSVTLTPTTAYETDIMVCTPYSWFDPDGDPEGAEFDWLVDGIYSAWTGDTLDGTYFDRGQVVECQVTPYDGFDYGNTLTSNPVTIANSAPPDPVMAITPDPLHTTDMVTCTIVAQDPDPDGDIISYEYEWYLDGVLQGYGGDTVPAADTELGDLWRCRARASDTYTTSAWDEDDAYVVPAEGDLIITELMIDPVTVSDTLGEYVEIYNTTADSIPLDGFVLRDSGSDSHTVNSGGSAHVLAGDYLVLSLNSNYGSNGQVTVDYQYNNITLTNGPDDLRLEYLGVTVDEVVWDWGGVFPAPSGASMSLRDTAMNATDNDDGASWCGSTSPLYQWGDFGTPGAANDDCDCWDSDGDGDGFGIDGSCGYTDCDDANPTAFPGATEICEDGIDQDCDGSDRACSCLESDDDGDGYGDAAACPPSTIDCDDNNANVFPYATEQCNLIDDDCDGSIDEGYDADGDGYTTCGGDCNDLVAAVNPGVVEACDGVDTNCDGTIPANEDDDDADGYLVCEGDCNDLDPAVYPNATEICDNRDNNCNGTVDESWSNCTVANGVAGCAAGACYIAACYSGFYDMDNNYYTGCEAEQDSWETYGAGGDSCTNYVDAGWTLPDSPSSSTAISGNIVPAGDVDYYYVSFTDTADADDGCDQFHIDIGFSSNPSSKFRIGVYESDCSLFQWEDTNDNFTNVCATELTQFEHNMNYYDATTADGTPTGECRCRNGIADNTKNLCHDDSIDLIIKVFQLTGTEDDSYYTLYVNNG